MKALPLLACLCLAATCAAAPPEFTLGGVERNSHPVTRLIAGDVVEIGGQNLGPATGCNGAPNYPTELCGVQVLIGEKPAGMVNVNAARLYFIVPKDTPAEGSVDMRVVYNGVSSAAVTMPAGREKTIISLDEPAYTDMAVWLRVVRPASAGQTIWPEILNPAGFGCNQVEVRHNGQPLPIRAGTVWLRAFGGNVHCGLSAPGISLRQGRLPLHLLYSFDQPGRYEVRFTAGNGTGPYLSIPATPKTQSDWTPIDVLPSPPGQRAKWLEDLRRRAPTDASEVLTDVLPSMLGHPDDASLEILLGYLYHPDLSVRRYAGYGLAYWPDDVVADRLLALLHTRGPSDSLIEALGQKGDVRRTRAAEVVDASLPFLSSDSMVEMKGALASMLFKPSPPYDPRVGQEVADSAAHILQVADKGDQMRFAYLLERMMESDVGLRTTILQSLREKLPQLNNADDAAIAAFIRDRSKAR